MHFGATTAVLLSHIVLLLHIMQASTYPTTQGALIRAVRGVATQADFAKRLGVDRSCLSRYESEDLGAPTAVINYCLRAIAGLSPDTDEADELQRALRHARELVAELEAATSSKLTRARSSRPPRSAMERHGHD